MTCRPEKPIQINRNCFTLIRYIAALEVIIGHCVEHFSLDKTSTAYQIFRYTLGMFPSVPIFFGLSGFLIWASLDRNDDLKLYAKKRFIRIYPELWLAVVLSAAAILVLYSSEIKAIPFALFCITQSTFLQFWTPVCLRGYGCGTPNGSLWTICTFVQFYIIAWIAHRVIKQKQSAANCKHATNCIIIRGGVLLLSLICTIGYPMLSGHMSEVLYNLLGQTILPYLVLFVIGILIYEYRDKMLPLLVRFWYIPLVLYYAVKIWDIDITGTYINPLSGALLLLTVFALGYRFSRISIRRDYSYGLYLYHMIIVNIFLQIRLLNGIKASLVVLIGSLIISVLSGEGVRLLCRKRAEG